MCNVFIFMSLNFKLYICFKRTLFNLKTTKTNDSSNVMKSNGLFEKIYFNVLNSRVGELKKNKMTVISHTMNNDNIWLY